MRHYGHYGYYGHFGIMDIIDIFVIMIITAWMALAGAVLALVFKGERGLLTNEMPGN